MNFTNKKSGFSLLELILAIGVFAISSVALVSLLIDSNISTNLSLQRTNALLYTKEGLDAVETIRDNSFSNLTDGNHGLTNDSGTWMFGGTSDTINSLYTRVVTIADTNPPATSTKTITINVSWPLTSGRLASTTLTTLLTNWKNN